MRIKRNILGLRPGQRVIESSITDLDSRRTKVGVHQPIPESIRVSVPPDERRIEPPLVTVLHRMVVLLVGQSDEVSARAVLMVDHFGVSAVEAHL